MHVIIHLRKFYRLVCFPKILKLIHIKLLCYRLYFMVVELGPHLERGAKIKVFENKVLKTIFGAKRDELTGEWRMLHIAELHTLYYSPNIISNSLLNRDG